MTWGVRVSADSPALDDGQMARGRPCHPGSAGDHLLDHAVVLTTVIIPNVSRLLRPWLLRDEGGEVRKG